MVPLQNPEIKLLILQIKVKQLLLAKANIFFLHLKIL